MRGFVCLLLLGGCATVGPFEVSETLPPCPASPNCVSSDATKDVHAIAPLRVVGDIGVAWATLLDYLRGDRSYTVVTHTDEYIHAEARTRWLRFVDDVVFAARPEAAAIAVRSASRLGYSDLGANRRRIEKLRAALAAQGVVSGG